jgi:transmembrane sensor
MDQNNFWILVGKKLNNEASPEELRELELLLKQDLADAYPLDVLEALWRQTPHQPPRFISHKLQQKWDILERKLDTGSAITDVQTTVNGDDVPVARIKRRMAPAYITAASLLLGLLSFFYWRNYAGDNHVKTNEITAPMSSISKIVLPDGTKVWLNSGSKLVYTTEYGNKYREIRLTGEAFFDVVKDAAHPFIVNTATMRIKVLGTAFNVRSYANDNASEASLIRGRIELTPAFSPDRKIILKPSEKLTINSTKTAHNNEDTALITLSSIHAAVNDSLPTEAEWLESKLVFDNEYFDEVARKMERWYNVSITFKDPGLEQKRFSGTFTKESLRAALAALKTTSKFHYSINKEKVTIY